MSNYSENINSLFTLWKKKAKINGGDESFITDGIICEDKYFKSDNYKILFLNREAYWNPKDPLGKYPDLTKLIRDWSRPKYLMWIRCGYIAKAINLIRAGNMPSIEILISERDKLNEYFMSCAVMNIKKYRGVGRSNIKDIQEHYNKDQELIHEEIKILNPQLVICGGISPILKQNSNFGKEISENVYEDDKRTYIDFYHPACRKSNEDFYGRFIELHKNNVV